MTTSEQIRAARERLGETQDAFGQRFGVDQSTIHRWETRGPPDHKLTQMAISTVLATLDHVELNSQPEQG